MILRAGLSRARILVVGLGVASLTLACASEHVGPPPSAPSAARAIDAMPADLDLVVRLDLKRIRDTLGASAMQTISERAVRGLHGADKATDALLVAALAATDTLWFGVRPASDFTPADTVFILAGHYARFDPHAVASTPPFEAPVDLGAGFRRYDRAAPKARAAPARIYTRGDDLIVSLSEAEIDSVERALEQHRGAPPLEPPEQGALSAVARPRVLPAALFDSAPVLERLARSATRLELSADLTSAGVDAALSLKFEDSSSASRVGSALTELRDALESSPGRLAKLATRLEITNAAEFVTLRLASSREELSEIVNCRGADCAW